MLHLLWSVLNWLKVWEWPGRIISLRKSWHEMKEATANRQIAEAGLALAEFEAQVARMQREIGKLQDSTRRAYPNRNIALDIRPAQGDNVEKFNEAMRRIRVRWIGFSS